MLLGFSKVENIQLWMRFILKVGGTLTTVPFVVMYIENKKSFEVHSIKTLSWMVWSFFHYNEYFHGTW